MYHPYFRGKQFELLCVREMAPIFKEAGFRPIIEPVRDVLGGLNRALDAMVEVGGRAIVIVNPHLGDLSDSGAPLSDLLKEKYLDLSGITAGILLKHDMTTAEALKCYRDHASHSPVLIHAGFGEAKILAEGLGNKPKISATLLLTDIAESSIRNTSRAGTEFSLEMALSASGIGITNSLSGSPTFTPLSRTKVWMGSEIS